jgi:aminoglycoside phosphotransferase (APT) family kinase protein
MDSDEAIQLFAEALARTHRINPNDVDVDHLPDQMALLNDKISQRPDELDDSLREGEIRAALEASRPDLTTNPTTFLHGDYWPNNTMWLDSELSAIIDWEDALIGDALQDVANARMELMMEIGPRAMEMFTEAYVRLAPDLDYGKLAFWDLYVALKPMGRIAVWAEHDDVREEMLRAGHWAFVQQALYCIDKDENIEYK